MASTTAPAAKPAPPTFEPQPEWSLLYQGAEARVWKIPDYLHPNLAAIAKERFVKTYRHATLDAKLTKSRCKAEAKSLLRARRGGVACPAVWGVQIPILYLEFLDGPTVRKYLEEAAAVAATGAPSDGPSKVASEMGTLIGKLHNTGTIHGDLTTSNMMMASKLEMRMHLIDFGLARVSQNPEEMAVDLYVLERAVVSTHPELEDTDFMDLVLQAYKATCSKSDAVLQRLSSVRMRGRKRECFG